MQGGKCVVYKYTVVGCRVMLLEYELSKVDTRYFLTKYVGITFYRIKCTPCFPKDTTRIALPATERCLVLVQLDLYSFVGLLDDLGPLVSLAEGGTTCGDRSTFELEPNF